jgi:ArsR family transcriptional regulator, arsenate/arsenite/antimonite-responsive transcriptional repressor
MGINSRKFLGALADSTRLRSLILMCRVQPLCVCELVWALDVSQPKMSRHLAALRDRGIVEDQKVANRVFYRLSPTLPEWAVSVLRNIADGSEKELEFIRDRQRLEAMPDRPDRPEVVATHGQRAWEEVTRAY